MVYDKYEPITGLEQEKNEGSRLFKMPLACNCSCCQAYVPDVHVVLR